MNTRRRGSGISLYATMNLREWLFGISWWVDCGVRNFKGTWKERAEAVFIDINILCFTLRFRVKVKGKWRDEK